MAGGIKSGGDLLQSIFGYLGMTIGDRRSPLRTGANDKGVMRFWNGTRLPSLRCRYVFLTRDPPLHARLFDQLQVCKSRSFLQLEAHKGSPSTCYRLQELATSGQS